MLCVSGSAALAQTLERGSLVLGSGAYGALSREQEPGARDTRLTFESADAMRGMDVFNQSHDKCGTIRDLVIDRGSGRVMNVVVDTRANMDLGNRKVAIPYRALRWDHERKHLMIDTSQSDRANWPEFVREHWSMTASHRGNLAFTMSSDYYERSPADRFETKVEPTRLLGKVKDVERRTTDERAEVIVVRIVTEDGKEETVTVGPSWYLAANSIAFFRDAPVELYVTRRDKTGQGHIVARTIGVGTSKTTLYDEDGWPVWQGVWPPAGAGEPDSAPQRTDRDRTPAGAEAKRVRVWVSPLVLASDIDGKSLHCRADMCGSVDDLIVECTSGRVAFVSIDPDVNFLGIADTKRLVPWGVVTVASDLKLWIDANKAMVVGAPGFPKSLETFASDGSYKQVYGSFGTPVVDFTNRSAASDGSPRRSATRSGAPDGTDRPAK
ncbi:MAG: PRC-barrel domain-containing protein [Planctomycetota bacterium]